MKSHSYRLNNTHVLALEGDMDSTARQDMTNLFAAMPANGNEVLLDLSQVSFIDSSGIESVVHLYKRLANQACYLHLVCQAGQPREIFRMLQIDRSVPCYQSVDDYVRGLTDGTI